MDGSRCPLDRGALDQELRRLRSTAGDSAYLFRLCCVSLVLDGHPAESVGGTFGVCARSIRRWVERYQDDGHTALRLPAGRPTKLNQRDLARLLTAMRGTPQQFGLAGAQWNGNLVQHYAQDRLGLHLDLRHCQRLLNLSRQEAAQEQVQRGNRKRLTPPAPYSPAAL